MLVCDSLAIVIIVCAVPEGLPLMISLVLMQNTSKMLDHNVLVRKAEGIETVLRTMGPVWIAVDEITAESDCRAMERAGWCGVGLLATAHAADIRDLLCRPVYRPLAKSGLFRQALVLRPDKTWRLEEIPCSI